jgi:hypothetical protein
VEVRDELELLASPGPRRWAPKAPTDDEGWVADLREPIGDLVTHDGVRA